jgi:hypothetical protein
MAKTPSIGVRLQPEVKRLLERQAAADRRSLASMISKICEEWLEAAGFKLKTRDPDT